MEKPSTLFWQGARSAFRGSSTEALPRLHFHERHPSVTKTIVQDNNPRKTKFTFEEAVDVWLRHWSGQFQHEIAAAAYVINSGRVSDVLNEVTYVGSRDEAVRRRGQTA
jgi:hypothetical protein